ncbi:MAG: TolB-like translocation protein, partial [Bacillota bacterium]
GSPDNGFVLYWRGGRLLALDLVSWTETSVAEAKGVGATAVSDDGLQVAALRTVSVNPVRRRLVIIDRATGTQQQIPCAADARALQWSPDGRYLAAESGPPGGGRVAIYESKDWRLSTEADQTNGLFSWDSRFYAYTFEVDQGSSPMGAQASGIGLIDLNDKAAAKRTLFDGRDGYAYRVRDRLYEGLIYERFPARGASQGQADQGPAGQTVEHGLVTTLGEVTVLRPKDPWLQSTTRVGAAEKVAARYPDAGPQTDLSRDRRWVLFTRPVNGVNWVFTWDMKTGAEPVALAPGHSGAWLKDPRGEPEPSTFPYYQRKIDDRYVILSARDVGGGDKLLEVTGNWPGSDDSLRIYHYYIYEDASGMYYMILGEGDNARFTRQDGTRLIFRAYAMFGRPGVSFPYDEDVFDLETKTLDRRPLFLPVDQVVETGLREPRSRVLTGVTRSQNAFTLTMKMAEGGAPPGSWRPPWSVSSYDAGSGEFTLTMRRMALAPGLKAGEAMCLGTGEGPIVSVTFRPDGQDLKAVFKIAVPAVWRP